MIDKKKIGKEYENLACEYLRKNGYSIITRNFSSKQGEIDIIANDYEYLCFIEVKYRKIDSLTKGIEAVDKKKQSKIYNTAKYYLYKNRIDDNKPCRFDVLTIDGDNINLIKNAF